MLPVAQFDTQSWRKMDADVKFAAARIERGSDLPLSDLATHLKLNNGELRLDPLRFGMAGGSLNAVVRLDGGKSRCAAVDMHARKLQLKQLLPNVAAMKRSLGQMNGDAS